MTSNEPVNLNLVDKVWADLAGDQGYTKIKYDAWEKDFHIRQGDGDERDEVILSRNDLREILTAETLETFEDGQSAEGGEF
jgi:hypothetical protein